MTKHKVATGLILWYMKKKGFLGWTSFWNTVYYQNQTLTKNKRLVRHELQHIEQMKRLGKFKFAMLYTYYNLKYGYYNNPFEIEARKAEK